MSTRIAVLSTSQDGLRGPEELVAQQISSFLEGQVAVRPCEIESMCDDAIYLCFSYAEFAATSASTLPERQQFIQYQDKKNSKLKEVWQSSQLRRCLTFYDCVKVSSVIEGSAGDCEYSPRSLAEKFVTTRGFFARRWEVSLMDAVAKRPFCSEEFTFFDSLQPLPTIEILVEYCHVLYGVEWLNTLDVASPARSVKGQHYLVLVGIYEGARRFLQDVEARLDFSDSFDIVKTVVEVFPAFAPPEDPRRPIAKALVREAAAALEEMWRAPPSTMAPHLVARMRKRYSLEELQRAQD
jgi:hypothetical protein